MGTKEKFGSKIDAASFLLVAGVQVFIFYFLF